MAHAALVGRDERLTAAMDDCTQGYRIDAALHPWGTRFEEPAERPCATAYGFETVYVTLHAAGAGDGRPVTNVAYEIANMLAPKDVFAELVKRLGPPTEIDRSSDESEIGSPGSVVLYAEWHRPNHQFSLSLYGAPRESDFGDSIGALYLTWTDTEAAAAPFVAPWQAAGEAVARAAAAPEGEPAIFTVEWAIFDPAEPPLATTERALALPELLETPKIVADRLGTHSFALWQGGGAWHLSHGRATVVLGAAPVHVHAIEPARGGGYAAIEVGAWFVRDAYGSRTIADAADALSHVPGLAIEPHRGHDV